MAFVGSNFGGPGGASDSELGDEARTYQHQAMVSGPGCVLVVAGWGERARMGLALLVRGQGEQRHGGREGLGVCWDCQAGRASNVSGQQLWMERFLSK